MESDVNKELYFSIRRIIGENTLLKFEGIDSYMLFGETKIIL